MLNRNSTFIHFWRFFPTTWLIEPPRLFDFGHFFLPTHYQNSTLIRDFRGVRKQPSMHGRKSTPKFLGTAKAFFCLSRGPKFSNFFVLDLHWVSVVRVLFDLFSDVGFSKDRGRNCHKAITFVFFWESSGVAWGHFRENGKVL